MPTVHSTMSSSRIAVSSRSWASIPKAAPSRWQRSAGRAARGCRPFSVPRAPPLVSRPNTRKRSKDAALGFHTCHGVDAVVPKPHVRLRPGLSRAGHGVGRVQRCPQPQGAAGAMAAHDARPQRRGRTANHPEPSRRNVGCPKAQHHERRARAGTRRLDRARPAASHDTRSASPRAGVLRMLSAGPSADCFSPPQDIRINHPTR